MPGDVQGQAVLNSEHSDLAVGVLVHLSSPETEFHSPELNDLRVSLPTSMLLP